MGDCGSYPRLNYPPVSDFLEGAKGSGFRAAWNSQFRALCQAKAGFHKNADPWGWLLMFMVVVFRRLGIRTEGMAARCHSWRSPES